MIGYIKDSHFNILYVCIISPVLLNSILIGNISFLLFLIKGLCIRVLLYSSCYLLYLSRLFPTHILVVYCNAYNSAIRWRALHNKINKTCLSIFITCISISVCMIHRRYRTQSVNTLSSSFLKRLFWDRKAWDTCCSFQQNRNWKNL